MKTSPACSPAPKRRGRPRKTADRVAWLQGLHAIWQWKRQSTNDEVNNEQSTKKGS